LKRTANENLSQILNDYVQSRYREREKSSPGVVFDEAAKLRNEENQYQLLMIKQVFRIWRNIESKREKRKAVLLYGFGLLSVVQALFIMVVVWISATNNQFNISDAVFVSVIFGTLVQIIGVVLVITKSLFNDKEDKIIDFISRWIKRS